MLDWDDLQTFLAIARHGSLSGAARALGVQQTTMGRRLAGLQARAGAVLLHKTPRGFSLTASGAAILGNVERMENEALSIERSITGRDVRLEGVVRIATVETLAVAVLVPAIPAFHTAHPGITLELATDTNTVSLTRREADIGLRLARPTQQDLTVRRVGAIGFGLYAAQAYLERHPMPDLTAGAPGHTVIQTLPDLMALPEMAWLTTMTGAAQAALRSNSRFAHRDACAAGIGMACLACYLGDPAGLVRLDTPMPGPQRELFLAVHADTRHTPRIRTTPDFLAATLRDAATRLLPISAVA